MSGRGPSICYRRTFCHSNTPLGCLLLRKRESVRRTRLSSTPCVRLRPSAGWLQGSLCWRFLLPPAFRFAGAEVLPGSGLGSRSSLRFTTSTGHFDQLILGVPFSLHGVSAPFRRRFPALPCGVIAGYPMQTVMRFSRCGAGFGNKKSPHNNLNLTIPSGMALVRVCYVAIRKLKT